MENTVVFVNGKITTAKEAALAADARLWGAIASQGSVIPTKLRLWKHLASEGRQKLTIVF